MGSDRVVLIALDHVDENCHDIVLAYAENFLDKNDKVIIMTVYNPRKEWFSSKFIGDKDIKKEKWSEIDRETRESAHIHLNQAKEILINFEIDPSKIGTYFLEGGHNIGEQICLTAEEFKPELLIIGRHQRNILHRTFLGTTSSFIVHNMKTPTILIHVKH